MRIVRSLLTLLIFDLKNIFLIIFNHLFLYLLMIRLCLKITSLYVFSTCPNNLHQVLSQDLLIRAKWSDTWETSFHAPKTKVFNISSYRDDHPLDFQEHAASTSRFPQESSFAFP